MKAHNDLVQLSKRESAGLIRYALIGVLVFFVDMGSFQGLVVAKSPLVVATVVAYCLGLFVHFLLNKFLNFRSFDRTIDAQARTYVVLSIALLCSSIVVIQFLTTKFGIQPIVAKSCAVILNFPLSFLGHRYLTFSRGIRATYRRVRLRNRTIKS